MTSDTGITGLVISASRRTDIPAFYMPWFMQQVRAGVFRQVNPFSRRVKRVPALPPQVHSIVFWSKDFGPFLAGGYGERLRELGYGLAFNFTVNSTELRLEPHVRALAERLAQLGELCARFGAASVAWRFDPICVYRDERGVSQDNLADFERIAAVAAAAGVRRCVASFVDLYAKVRKRQGRAKLDFIDPPLSEKARRVLELNQRLRPLGIALALCCEAELLATLPASAGIAAADCVSGRLLMELYGGCVSLARDAGQRRNQGCGCTRSVDIGDYQRHPCRHDCLFCYANPISDGVEIEPRTVRATLLPHPGAA